MEINAHTHSLVYNESGEPMTGEEPNTVVILSNIDGSLYAIDKNDANSLFGLSIPNSEKEDNHDKSLETDKSIVDTNERSLWSEQDTLALIEEYKAHEHKFKSTTVRNASVWQQIASNLKNHTAIQCENRFKYLKNQYIKKVESLGPKNTGGTFIKFPYFDQFEDIFGSKPNVRPVAIASSSKPDKIEENKRKPEENDSFFDDSKPKKKKSNLQKQMEDMAKKSDAREAAREQRHKENLKRKDEALQIFNNLCTNITEILKKGMALKGNEIIQCCYVKLLFILFSFIFVFNGIIK